MEFCPKCGALMMQKRKNFSCPRCGYSSKKESRMVISEKMGDKKESVGVFLGKEAQVFPIVEEKCKKCGNERAYFWTVQTRSGDEAETKFFKCTKCGYTWREYR